MTHPSDEPDEPATPDVHSPFRCAPSSVADGEALAGTAPTDPEWLFVEYAGSWGAKAVAESRLPEEVRAHLAGRSERVQLIRRHGRDERSVGAPIRVFAASLDNGNAGASRVTTAVLDDARDLIDLNPTDLTAYDEPLWFVCTNGKRDICCAEQGRPVAAALADRWPEATWETSHLGGHRFAATLLALPSGLTLGRLDPASAIKACEEVIAGLVPGLLTRGHAGRPAEVQYAETHLRTEFGYRLVRATGSTKQYSPDTTPDTTIVTVRADEDDWVVEVVAAPGEPRRASCADLKLKATPVFTVVSARMAVG
ncbi:sucrase ferredoxin [Nocardioides salsibiostraticola]